MIDWTKAPDFYSSWGSDSEVANRLRWVVNHPGATHEDLLDVLDGLIMPVDVEAKCEARIASGDYADD